MKVTASVLQMVAGLALIASGVVALIDACQKPRRNNDRSCKW